MQYEFDLTYSFSVHTCLMRLEILIHSIPLELPLPQCPESTNKAAFTVVLSGVLLPDFLTK